MTSLGPVVPLQHLDSSGQNTSGGQPAPSPSALNQPVAIPSDAPSSALITQSNSTNNAFTSNILNNSGPSLLNGSTGTAPPTAAAIATTASTATTSPSPQPSIKQEHRLLHLLTSAKAWTVLGGILGFIAFIYTIILNKWTARNDALQACNSMPDPARGSTYCARLISEGVTQPPIRRSLHQLEQVRNSRLINLIALRSVNLAGTITVTLSIGVFTLMWFRPRMRLPLRPMISLVRQASAIISSTIVYGQSLIWSKNLGQGDLTGEELLSNDEYKNLPGWADELFHDGEKGTETPDDANDYSDGFWIADNAIESDTDVGDQWEDLPEIDGMRYYKDSDFVPPVVFREESDNYQAQTYRNGICVKWTTMNAGDVHSLQFSSIVRHLQASKWRLPDFPRESGILICHGVVVARNGQVGGVFNANMYNKIYSIRIFCFDVGLESPLDSRSTGYRICSIFLSLLHKHHFHDPFLLDNVHFAVKHGIGPVYSIAGVIYLIGLEDLKRFFNHGDELDELDDTARVETEEEKILRYTQSIGALNNVLSQVLGFDYTNSDGEVRKAIPQNDWSKEETDANYRRLACELSRPEPCTPENLLAFFDFSVALEHRRRLKIVDIFESPNWTSSSTPSFTDMPEDVPNRRDLHHRWDAAGKIITTDTTDVPGDLPIQRVIRRSLKRLFRKER